MCARRFNRRRCGGQGGLRGCAEPGGHCRTKVTRMNGGAVPGGAVGSGTGDRPELLVLRALKLGDLLVAVPALKAIRRTFPEHRLRYAAQGWLSEALGLVGGYELLPTHGLDEPLAVRPGVVDVAVNLHGNGPESAGRI